MRENLTIVARKRIATADSALIRPRGATFPHRGRLGTHALSVAAMTALIVCMRFSASWNTIINEMARPALDVPFSVSGFPLGGSCQRPRPLTDEGKPCRRCPQAGSGGRFGPHPAPRGKAKSLQNSNISLPNLQSCVARTIIVDARLSRTGNKCKKDPSGGYKQHEE